MKSNQKVLENSSNKEEKNRKKILLIILLPLLCFIALSFTYGKGIYDAIQDQIIEVLNLHKPTAPTIIAENKNWTKETIVRVEKDSETKDGLSHYEYCISSSDNTKKCNWQGTRTKNAVINQNGLQYVTFRAVDKEGRTGYNSNTEIVYIDNNNPVIEKVIIKEKTTSSITLQVEAKDNESGIEGYYYSTNGITYEKGKLTYTYQGLESGKLSTIYIQVVDIVGNYTNVSMEVETLKDETDNNQTGNNPEGNKPSNNNQNGNNPNGNNQTGNNPDGNTGGGTTPGEGGNEPGDGNNDNDDDDDDDDDEEVEIPVINLDKVPVTFEYGEKYDLPSYYSFGKGEGTVECVVGGKEYTDTSTLKIGKHLIVCNAISSSNIRVMVEKEVTVTVSNEEELLLEGWIRLNLYYPDNSTNWQWRLDTNEIRDGYSSNTWQDYTGPILIKINDTDKVYIRYDLMEETVIIPPKGRVTVDIEPTSYILEEAEKTKVKINYDKDALTKQYRINGGEWQDYKGEFQVLPNTLIEAQATKNEDVYTSDGEYIYTSKRTGTDSVFVSQYVSNDTQTGNVTEEISYETITLTDGSKVTSIPPTTKPGIYLVGPVINANPTNELTESVEVTVTPQEEAEKIYIKIGNGNYIEYTIPVEVTQNVIVSAYYIRLSDGKISDTNYYYVQNIRVENKPYVRIDATPSSYLTDALDEVKVTISGSNYNKLEYSLDGEIYREYTEPLVIRESSTIYAKGTNNNGVTIESLTIVTSIAPTPKEELNINITANPDANGVLGLVNKTEITINYDPKATNRYYKLGYGDTWKEYQGPFEVADNTTVYAYCTSNTGVGSNKKNISFLITGISDPIIIPDTYAKTQQVKIEITYDNTSTNKYYKIGNGEYQEYNGPFYVFENTKITAYSSNVLKYESTSEYTVKNIVPLPDYTILDMGAYYIIKLNYPPTATIREYKWKADGVWGNYDPKGILLIKPEYRNEVEHIENDGIKVKDENGKDVVFTTNYYFLDVSITELNENLYMRWDSMTPAAPQIITNPSEPSKTKEVRILYSNALVKKYYRIVDEDNNDTDWLEYTGALTINKNNVVIYAKGKTINEKDSYIASTKISSIDYEAPTINIRGELEEPKQKVILTVNAIDNIQMYMVKYAKGKQTAEYFAENGTSFRNNGTITITENGIYTIYAIDQAGNESTREVEVNNIDINTPAVSIDILTDRYTSQIEVNINYGDSSIKEYRIGNGSYQTYIGTLTIKSSDVFDKKNPDGSITIYARGIDAAGNTTIVDETTYLLDTEPIAVPIIKSVSDYPNLTEYGVKILRITYITYDQTRDDITNYYSEDNGETWKIYTGPFETNAINIIAKSIKNISGLTLTATKRVELAGDALPTTAYDNNTTTYTDAKNKMIEIDKSVWGKQYYLKYDTGSGLVTISNEYYDKDGNLLSRYNRQGRGVDLELTIPEQTAKIVFKSDVNYDIYEIKIVNKPVINVKAYYPVITETGIIEKDNLITINYFQTSVQKLYSLDNGETWLQYNQPIELELTKVIKAKGIDKYGIETDISNYTSAIKSDSLDSIAYDNDTSTSITLGQNVKKYLEVDPSMIGKTITIDSYAPNYYTGIEYYSDSSTLITSGILNDRWRATTSITIPENTTIIAFKGAGQNTYIYEISVSDKPVVNVKSYYPTLTEQGIEASYNEVTIKYLSYFSQKLYSIDNGQTWQQYNGSFNVNTGTTILAKAVDSKNVETATSSLTVSSLNDMLLTEAYDGNKNTNTSIPASTSKTFTISNNLTNKTLRLYLSGIPAANSYIKLYDTTNKELANAGLTGQIVILLIPKDTVKAVINSGSAVLKVSEVNTRNTNLVKGSLPKFEISDTTWSASKTIAITYPEGNYINEYSIDNGTTWLQYQTPITINSETTVIARSTENENIISSSTFTVTKVDNIVPTIELDIPDEISYGTNYNLPTSYTVGKSGGIPVCKIGDTEYKTTSEILEGTYLVECSITSNTDLTADISKNIIIIEEGETNE